MRKRSLAPLVLCLVVSIACQTGATNQPSAGGTMVFGKTAENDTINPLKATTDSSFQTLGMVYQQLTQPTDSGDVAGLLASSWDTPSPTSYLFHLRPGVKFSNGRAFTSDDVVTTLNQYKTASVYGWFFTPALQTVTAVDSSTVRFDLSKPDPLLPKELEVIWMLPGQELTAGTFDPNKDMLGTGPYMVKDHLQGVSWTLVRNPHYWRQGLPNFDEIDIKIIPDDASRLAALKSGSVDFALFDSPDTVKLLQGSPNTKVIVQGTTNIYQLALNSVSPKSPLLDRRVRQAINLALDRAQIISTALGGVGQPTGVPAATFPDGCNLSGVTGASQDLTQAKSLLAQAGISKLSFTVVIPNASAGLSAQIAQVVQSQLAQIGVTMQISIIDGATLNSDFGSGNFDAWLDFSAGAFDATYLLGLSDPALAGFDAKFTADDPQLDALIIQAKGMAPGAARTQVMQQACQLIFTDSEWLPLATRPNIFAYRSDRVNPKLLSVEPNTTIFRKIDEFKKP